MEALQEFLFVDCENIKTEPQVKPEATIIDNSSEPECIFPDSLPQIAPHIKTRTKVPQTDNMKPDPSFCVPLTLAIVNICKGAAGADLKCLRP
uniref:Uncharacterized protein n=1 Tax=Timema shepardi TaxID=629360 RepID=A0A7R9G8C3_TIMSH|nr:unnamed protein product [Timema shepardi]